MVYMRVTNNGSVPFKFKTAVSVTNYTEPVNVFGQKFHLQDHLRFGLVPAETEQELDEKLQGRTLAAGYADTLLNHYSTDQAILAPKETTYLALIVRMPENVNNVANYREETVPRVELGMIVTAMQVNAPEE